MSSTATIGCFKSGRKMFVCIWN